MKNEFFRILQDIRTRPAAWAGDFFAITCAGVLWVVLFFL